MRDCHGPCHPISSNELEGAGWIGGPRPVLNSSGFDGTGRGLLPIRRLRMALNGRNTTRATFILRRLARVGTESAD